MKRYDQNAFIAFVLFCGLALLFSCSTTRHTDTVTTVAARDTTHTHFLDSATTTAEIGRAEFRDTIKQTDRVTGTLKIERDTAGRPVLFIWNTSALMQTTAGQKWHFDANFNRHTSSVRTDTAATRAEDIQKEEKKATKIGPRLEDYIGAGLLLFVILYVIYVIIENLWQSRKK